MGKNSLGVFSVFFARNKILRLMCWVPRRCAGSCSMQCCIPRAVLFLGPKHVAAWCYGLRPCGAQRWDGGRSAGGSSWCWMPDVHALVFGGYTKIFQNVSQYHADLLREFLSAPETWFDLQGWGDRHPQPVPWSSPWMPVVPIQAA